MPDRIIVALDTPDAQSALDLASSLRGRARWLKVGMTLFCGEGPAVVHALSDMGFDVFLDLKLHDIPHQVEGAARALGGLGVGMVTVHAAGGPAMVAAAVKGAAAGAARAGVPRPAVLAVTVLTSLDAVALASTGVRDDPSEQVRRLTALAIAAGADGVVCSPQEVAEARNLVGPRALVVTPGIRPVWAEVGDQARVASPAAAFSSGASHIVVGRPVTGAKDPAAAFDRIAAEE
ncbi:MAG TPA: orotidine-5'-phosphate decarboxylase [Coriobacteriia bacterium]